MRTTSNRILIVDDSEAIHKDIIKILNPPRTKAQSRGLEQIEMELFDDEPAEPIEELEKIEYVIDSAFQGKEALQMVASAEAEGNPYALVFMDVRMPPGMNGIETMEKIWREYPNIEMVIVSAFSDYTWEDILQRIGITDRLMILRKPFDQITVKQLALALTKKYNLSVKVTNYIESIETEVKSRNEQMEKMMMELKGMGHH